VSHLLSFLTLLLDYVNQTVILTNILDPVQQETQLLETQLLETQLLETQLQETQVQMHQQTHPQKEFYKL